MYQNVRLTFESPSGAWVALYHGQEGVAMVSAPCSSSLALPGPVQPEPTMPVRFRGLAQARPSESDACPQRLGYLLQPQPCLDHQGARTGEVVDYELG